MKNLSALNDLQFRTSYRDFFIKNADSLWANSLLRLTVNGSTLSAAISTGNGANFASLGSGNDSTFATGKIGLRATQGSARFDVVRVTGN